MSAPDQITPCQRNQLMLYPGAGHGFPVPGNPSYNEAAAGRHRRRVTTLFAGSRAAPTD